MEKYEPPKPTTTDKILAVAKTTISAIPIVGEGVSVVMELVGTPIQRRDEEWMENVGKALRNLEQSQLCLFDSLQENNAFIDTLIRASQSAKRTGNTEKRKALRNAVLNAALPTAPDEELQSLFVRLVDEFTSYHIIVLQRIALSGSKVSFDGIADDLPEQGLIIRSILGDLEDHQLVDVVGRSSMGERGGIIFSGLSGLGQKFLDFITSPLPDENPEST